MLVLGMSQEAEEIKKLLSFKKRLEKRVEKLESELKELQTILDAVNSMLLAKGFKRAEITKTTSSVETTPKKEEIAQQLKPAPQVSFKEVTPLTTIDGELLATLYIGDNFLKIVLAEDKGFNVNTPPFNQFFVERVLSRMQQKDAELAKDGELGQGEIFSYNIQREGDLLREIHIKNFDAERLKELRSSLKWTLEKMLEKMKSQS